jgi:hypothetical protein
MDACTDAYAMVTVRGMGKGVYTSWAQNEGYNIPPRIRVVCIILKSRWEPLTSTLLDYASGSMGGNFPWLTITGTAIGSK